MYKSASRFLNSASYKFGETRAKEDERVVIFGCALDILAFELYRYSIRKRVEILQRVLPSPPPSREVDRIAKFINSLVATKPRINDIKLFASLSVREAKLGLDGVVKERQKASNAAGNASAAMEYVFSSIKRNISEHGQNAEMLQQITLGPIWVDVVKEIWTPQSRSGWIEMLQRGKAKVLINEWDLVPPKAPFTRTTY